MRRIDELHGHIGSESPATMVQPGVVRRSLTGTVSGIRVQLQAKVRIMPAFMSTKK